MFGGFDGAVIENYLDFARDIARIYKGIQLLEVTNSTPLLEVL
jgi:hypothetical protein